MTDDDCYYMGLALAEARQAGRDGEVPVGAVVVGPGGAVLGRGHNLTQALGDVTAHAEMLAVTAAAQALGAKTLDGCTLYVTVEPCLMCAGAIAWARPARLVIGAMDPKRGFTTMVADPPGRALHPRTAVTIGVRADESRSLMQEFFRQRR